jgi:hypothetical protein
MSYLVASAEYDEIDELRRLRRLIPPELQSWVSVETTNEVHPLLARCKEIVQDQVEIQIDLVNWEKLPIDQRNLLFWHELARVYLDIIPRSSPWGIIAICGGLGAIIGQFWVGNNLLAALALALCGVSGYRLYQKNNSNRIAQELVEADQRAIALATRFGYTIPNADQSLAAALRSLIDGASKKSLLYLYSFRLAELPERGQ